MKRGIAAPIVGTGTCDTCGAQFPVTACNATRRRYCGSCALARKRSSATQAHTGVSARYEDARGVEAAYQRALVRQRRERLAALRAGQTPRLSVSAETAWTCTGRGTPSPTRDAA